MNRLARMVALTAALLVVFTAGAGAAVARLLPARLALFQQPAVSAGLPAAAGAALTPTTGGRGPATPGGVAARLAPYIGGLGSVAGAQVVDLRTGQVLFGLNSGTGFAPASTTKLATAVAALAELGPAARFSTTVRTGAQPGQIVLVGGGDPTLAAGHYPAAAYPEPSTLAGLAAATARALRVKGESSVRLGYDDSRFTDAYPAPGWPNYIGSGNVAPITSLEVDQGRLTSSGRPEDLDDPGTPRRSYSPALDAARAFARFLKRDGITVHGRPSRATGPAGSGAAVLAQVQSPQLAVIVQWMLAESNNVIAETLARQVAIATGRPATFSGAAAAVSAVDRRLGVSGISLVDGSGLSPLDRITPAALVKLVALASAAAHGGLRPVITGLPVANFYGTLSRNSGAGFGPFGRAAYGTVRAKTGNLDTVASLAGVAYTKNGQLLGFAFMANQFRAKQLGAVKSALARLATVLAGCGCR